MILETVTKLANEDPSAAMQFMLRLLQEHYKGSLLATATKLLGYDEIRQEVHGKIIETLESPTKRKLIVCPRGAFKSTLCSIAYPIWLILRDPNVRILIDSELYSNSRNFLRAIRLHLESNQFESVFGRYRTDNCWTNALIAINRRTKPMKEATVTVSGIGAQKTSMHFDYIIADDLNSAKNSGTKENREKVIDHYKYYTSLLEPHGTIVVVGTRYSDDDVIGHIMANEVNVQKGLI